MTPPNLKSLLDFAVDAAWRAGRQTLGHYQTAPPTERKADNSPVTIADRQAEETIRNLIQRHWPGHAILGEEYGTEPGDGQLTWINDPIDGTQSFIRGVPFYSTLLALTAGQEPLLGVMYFPALDDMVYAAQGLGCFWNGRPARVSTIDDLTKAAVMTSTLNYFEPLNRAAAWQNMVHHSEIQRTWGDAYGYAMVATGRAEVMIDPIMEVWDAAPLQVILEEAGGTFTDWQGTPTIYNRESIATNGHLLEAVMALVQPE